MGLEVSIGPRNLIAPDAWRSGRDRAIKRAGATLKPNGGRFFLLSLKSGGESSELYDSDTGGSLDVWDFTPEVADFLFALIDETGLGLAAQDAPVVKGPRATLDLDSADGLPPAETVADGAALFALWDDAFARANEDLDVEKDQ